MNTVKVRFVRVEYRFFKENRYELLKEDELPIGIIPNKGDIIHLSNNTNGKTYRVEQKDLIIHQNPKEYIVKLFLLELS